MENTLEDCFFVGFVLCLLVHFDQCLHPSVANESNVPKASTEEISVKVSNMPSNNPSGRQTQCQNTETEGATAKVNFFFYCKI